MNQLKSLNKYFLKYKWLFLLGAVFVALANIFQVYAPQYIGKSIDLVQTNLGDYKYSDNETQRDQLIRTVSPELLRYALFFIGLTIVRGVFMFFMRQTIIVMSRHIEYDQKNELFAKYETLTPAFFKRNNTGDLMSRVAEDIGRVRQYVGPAIMYFLNLLFTFVLVIWVMMDISPLLTLYVLLPLPILSVSIYYVNSIINKKSELIQQQLSTLTNIAQESFSGIRVIKAYAQEKNTSTYFSDECEIYKNRSLSLSRVDAMFQPLMVLLIGISILLTVFIGGWQVMLGNITAGNVAEFVVYVNMLTWPVTSLGWVASIVQRAAASQKRINEFLDIKPDIEASDNPTHIIKGTIEFKNVTFTYPDTGVVALKDISFRIIQGQKIAIIGRTGSGKTTIADLIVRMYDPEEGSIFIDGNNLKDFNLQDIRKYISYVPQDVFLFSDTVKNNIAFGHRNSELEEIKKYAGFASIDSDIELFKDGYETMVGERGVTLSGGQKQRISIARAFIKNSPVIILDDCLSAVDTNTEKVIMQNMRRYLESKTAIIITHRIYSLIDFDRIIVIDNHRIAESGTHDELVKLGGIYAEILEKQKLEEPSGNGNM